MDASSSTSSGPQHTAWNSGGDLCRSAQLEEPCLMLTLLPLMLLRHQLRSQGSHWLVPWQRLALG